MWRVLARLVCMMVTPWLGCVVVCVWAGSVAQPVSQLCSGQARIIVCTAFCPPRGDKIFIQAMGCGDTACILPGNNARVIHESVDHLAVGGGGHWFGCVSTEPIIAATAAIVNTGPLAPVT